METVPLCPRCVSGHIHVGNPIGREVVVGGVNAYISEPQESNPSRAIIIATDVFGYKLVNTRLVADKLAQQGFLVVVPDIFAGNELPQENLERMLEFAGFGASTQKNWFMRFCSKVWTVFTVFPVFLAWMLRNGTKKKQEEKIPIYDSVINDLRTKHDIEKVGIAGYCYGVFYCIHYASQHSENVNAVAMAHGKIRVPEDVNPLVKPSLFICADNDPIFAEKDRKKAQEILEARDDKDQYIFRFYPKTYHGFVIRGDETNEVVENAKADAIDNTVQFFQRYLSVD